MYLYPVVPFCLYPYHSPEMNLIFWQGPHISYCVAKGICKECVIGLVVQKDCTFALA